MLKLLKKIFGDKKSKDIQELQPIVTEIIEEYEKIKSLSDEELKAKTTEFKEKIQSHVAETKQKIEELKTRLQTDEDFDRHGAYDELDQLEDKLNDQYEEVLNEILPVAFAVIKTTCERLVGKSWTVMGNKITWDMVPYDVQLMGGVVLHQGKIAEMATGEGKTLVATLPIYLNALTGRGVHLITVNDYLAQRDSEWMGEIYKFHGLTVGCIINTMDTSQRKSQYNSDITYGTNNEFGFDYLRDNMAGDKELQVQRGHNYAIVDEVDSVLIDEARTPLIISGPVDVDDHKYNDMKPRIEKLFRLQKTFVAQIVQQAEEILARDGENSAEAGVLILRASRGLPKHNRLTKVLSEPSYRKLLQQTELEYLREKAKNMYIIDDYLYFVIV